MNLGYEDDKLKPYVEPVTVVNEQQIGSYYSF